MNGQSRHTFNIEHKTQNEDKQNIIHSKENKKSEKHISQQKHWGYAFISFIFGHSLLLRKTFIFYVGSDWSMKYDL